MIREFVYISQYSVFIPILIGIIQLSSTNNYLKYLLVLVSASCITDFATSYNYAWRDFMWPLYDLIQYTTLILIFIAAIDTKSIKNILIGVLASLVLYTFIYHTYLVKSDTIYPTLQVIQSFVFICISLYYFNYIHTNTPILNLFSFPLFWISTAVLLYFAGNFFLYAAINMFTIEKVYLLYFPIHNVLNATKNILFGVAFYMQYQNSKIIKAT